MILNIKLIFIFPLLFYSFFLFSQEHSTKNMFNIELKKIGRQYKQEVNFQKAQSFFLKKEWDSTLVYSMKQLAVATNGELNNYCHYIRAESFRSKKLFAAAKKEYDLITTTFPFFYKVEFGLGALSMELKEFSKAVAFLQKTEESPDKSTYDYNRSALIHNLGICYMELEEYSKAEKYLLEAIELQKLEKDIPLLIGSYMDLANLYYNQFKDKQAIPYFEKAYQLSKNIKEFDIKRRSSFNMAVVEENRKDFPKALLYRKEYEQWKDSLNDQNKVWAIADIEKKFAVKEKQKEVNTLQTENNLKEAQRNSLLYSSILLLLLLGVSFYFYKQKTKQNKIILAQKEELDALNATKDKLFSIVSHDLRSSVSALKTSNTKLQESLASKDFSALDHLLHNNSSIANGTYNLLDNLLNWALLQTKQAYFYIESLHLKSIVDQIAYNYKPLLLNKNISFENTVPASVFVMADQDSLKIIIRNILDNAFKFSKENGAITLYIRSSEDNFYHLVIEDTGAGMSELKKQELLKETVLLSKKGTDDAIGTGLGMQLCKSMVHKNGGTLAIESQEGIGTKIIIILPKIENNG